MSNVGWKALPFAVLLIVAEPANATEPTLAFVPAPAGSDAAKMRAFRPASGAMASCGSAWSGWLGAELIFDDGFEDNAVCSEAWSFWLGACAANQGCAAGACACLTGFSDCNSEGVDGCECSTPFCCAGSCATTHSNGLGQSYFDCAPLGTPGTAATYTLAMATAARAASVMPGSDASGPCGAAQGVARIGETECAVWTYTHALAGFVRVSPDCQCPDGTSPNWN